MTTENISILTPTYNRRKFLPLFLRNLKIQDYPHDKIEVVIDDDGSEKMILDEELDEIKEFISPMKLKYIKSEKRRSIGKKRNDLIKNASSKIFCFLDDDDIYLPTYLSYSYHLLKDNKAGCVGSNKMLFTMSDKNFDVYAIDCGDVKSLIHEATIMMTKKYYKSSQKFANNSQGEGNDIFIGNEKNVVISDVLQVMVCLQHSGNTIDKMRFAKDEMKVKMEINDELKNMISKILENS